jgi:hypothetical protein
MPYRFPVKHAKRRQRFHIKAGAQKRALGLRFVISSSKSQDFSSNPGAFAFIALVRPNKSGGHFDRRFELL